VKYHKENSRTSFLQVGVSDVGRNLLIFSVKTKMEKMSKIFLEQRRLIRSLPILRQWKYKKKVLIVKVRFYFIFLFTIKTYFFHLLGLDLLYLFFPF
jgi:hypothetical protein